MDVVYVVEHAYESPDGTENIKMIGVYSDEVKANEAIQRLKVQPGFREHPDDFNVSALPLNKDHWTDGFISWDQANEDPNGSTQ